MADAFELLRRGLQRFLEREDEIDFEGFFGNSEAILKAEYDPSEEILEIVFTSGAQYFYYDFGPRKWANFEKAASKGQYFAYKIRDNYVYSRGF